MSVSQQHMTMYSVPLGRMDSLAESMLSVGQPAQQQPTGQADLKKQPTPWCGQMKHGTAPAPVIPS